MASPDAEIKDGFSLPVWMKNKPTRDYEPFPASPPGQEDSFFYIRLPTSEALYSRPQTENLGILGGVKERNLTHAPMPCYDAMNGGSAVNTITPQQMGADDPAKSDGPSFGNSLKISNRMISSSNRSVSSRGFTVATPMEEEEVPKYVPHRRGSKSLPASPLHTPPTSPNSRRKVYGNRYFTSPFEANQDAVNSRSWLTNALLGFKKDITTSTSTLAEEDGLEIRLQGSLVESVESLGPLPRKPEPKTQDLPTQEPKLTKPAQVFRAKPSELREMNFWSPTSM